MKSVMQNTFALFKRNKEMIYLITIQPIIIFLLMSFLLPYTTMHTVVVSNNSGSETAERIMNDLTALEGIRIQETAEDKIAEKLSGGNAELGVVITDTEGSDIPTVSFLVVGESEIETVVELCVTESLIADSKNSASVVSVNSAKTKWLSISNSLAFMIFKTLTAGNLLGALIIQERRNRMKDRILLSGTKKSSYLLGMSLVYLVFMMLGSIIYYLVGLVLNFDFGMRNSIGFLLMLFVSNILSVAIYVFFAAFLKREESLSFVGTFILMPMALFAGVLFPFRFMPEAMQKIGSCFPQRWIALGIEKIQKSGSVVSCWREAAMVIGLSLILFIVGINCESSQIQNRRIKTNE